MNTILPVLLCLLTLITGAPAVHAGEWTDAIQKQYETLVGFSSNFRQTLTNASTGETEVRTGTLSFKRPGLVRWNTQTPERELLIVGTNIVWDYFPDEETAYKYPVSQVLSSRTMIRFISGKGNLDEDFKVEDQGVDQGLRKIKLIPREPEANMVLAYIWVNQDTKMLEKVFVVDFFGNGNELALAETMLNPELGEELFEFSPPEGVDVLDNTEQQAN